MRRTAFVSRIFILMFFVIASFSVSQQAYAQVNSVDSTHPWAAFIPYVNSIGAWPSPVVLPHSLQAQAPGSYVIFQPPPPAAMCGTGIPTLYLIWVIPPAQTPYFTVCLQYYGSQPITTCSDGATVPVGQN